MEVTPEQRQQAFAHIMVGLEDILLRHGKATGEDPRTTRRMEKCEPHDVVPTARSFRGRVVLPALRLKMAAAVNRVLLALPVPGREKLPNRREKDGFKFKIMDESGAGGSWKVFLTTGRYPDGRLGEIFLDTAKDGATLRGLMGGFAIAVSLGLQHGVPLEEFVEAFSGMKFAPYGMVLYEEGDEGDVVACTSFLDLIAQQLRADFRPSMEPPEPVDSLE